MAGLSIAANGISPENQAPAHTAPAASQTENGEEPSKLSKAQAKRLRKKKREGRA
jgi:hypothetical protein